MGWYRKHFRVNAGSDSKIFLEFEGSHQVTDVWIDGKLAGRHMISGYTPFHFDITGMVDRNADNVVAVRVDHTRNPDVPPDGGRFDYILYRNECRLCSASPVVKLTFYDDLCQILGTRLRYRFELNGNARAL